MTTYIEKVDGNAYYVAEFSASELRTEAQYIRLFWEAFSIPYKHKSLDVLLVSMQELEWLGYRNFKVVINGYHTGKFAIDHVLHDLEAVSKHWKENGNNFEIIRK